MLRISALGAGQDLKPDGCSGCRAHTARAALVPEVAAHWHPTNNGDKRPEHFGAYSCEKVWWQHTCERPGQPAETHVWEARINSQTQIWQKLELLSCPSCYKLEKRCLISRSGKKI